VFFLSGYIKYELQSTVVDLKEKELQLSYESNIPPLKSPKGHTKSKKKKKEKKRRIRKG
jgi:hypothetical protein